MHYTRNYQFSEVSYLFFLMLLLNLLDNNHMIYHKQFYEYFLIDEECGVIESIIKSAEISRGCVLELFILGATLSLIILISLINTSYNTIF